MGALADHLSERDERAGKEEAGAPEPIVQISGSSGDEVTAVQISVSPNDEGNVVQMSGSPTSIAPWSKPAEGTRAFGARHGRAQSRNFRRWRPISNR